MRGAAASPEGRNHIESAHAPDTRPAPGIRDVHDTFETPGMSFAPGMRKKMSGRVIDGRHLGRLLGVPTANIALAGCDAALYGSWAALAATGGVLYRAIAHVGVRPSVGAAQPLLEVHLFDFEGDLYGHSIDVQLLRKVSGEMCLASLDLLRAKIAGDVRDVQRYFEENFSRPLPKTCRRD